MWTPAYGYQPYSGWIFPLAPLEMPSQTYPEVSFSNFLGASQSNQGDPRITQHSSSPLTSYSCRIMLYDRTAPAQLGQAKAGEIDGSGV